MNNPVIEVDDMHEVVPELKNDNFSVQSLHSKEMNDITNKCKYVKQLDSISKLHILQPNAIISAYKNCQELGLFYLFVKKGFLTNNIR